MYLITFLLLTGLLAVITGNYTYKFWHAKNIDPQIRRFQNERLPNYQTRFVANWVGNLFFTIPYFIYTAYLDLSMHTLLIAPLACAIFTFAYFYTQGSYTFIKKQNILFNKEFAQARESYAMVMLCIYGVFYMLASIFAILFK